MLFEGLDHIKRKAIMSTIILMITGLVLLIVPDSILPLINDIFGFALAVFAVVSVFNYLASRKALIHYIYLTIGLLGGLLGIMFLASEDLFVGILIAMVCIFPIFSGMYGIYHALVFARRSGREGWWILIILSCALIAFGGFVFYNPWVKSTLGTIRIIGGTMLYTSFVSGMRMIWLWPIQKSEGGREA